MTPQVCHAGARGGGGGGVVAQSRLSPAHRFILLLQYFNFDSIIARLQYYHIAVNN